MTQAWKPRLAAAAPGLLNVETPAAQWTLSRVSLSGSVVADGDRNADGRFMESKPANELEGLIRDKLPDPTRRHLVDVIIDLTDVDGLGPNWTAQPVWSHDVTNNNKQEFTSALFAVLRDYELLTDD